MESDQEFDHSGRHTRWFDADLGWCICSVCVHLPLYLTTVGPADRSSVTDKGHKVHAPTSQTFIDPDPLDTFGCVSTDPVPGPDGWELGGEGG